MKTAEVQMAAARDRGGVLGKVTLICAFLVVAGIVGIGLSASAWLKRYLRSDELLQRIESEIARRLSAECRIAPMQWAGYRSVYTDSIELLGADDAWFERIAVEGVRMKVALEGLRGGTVRVEEVMADRLDLRVTEERPGKLGDIRDAGTDSSGTGVLASFVPKGFDWKRVEIANLALHVGSREEADFSVEGAHIKAKPLGANGLELRARGGWLQMPWTGKLGIQSASLRVTGQGIFLDDVEVDSEKFGLLVGSGKIPLGGGQMVVDCRVIEMDLGKVLPESLQTSIRGKLSGKITLSGEPGKSVACRGNVEIEDGLLEQMAVLDEIARHTRTDRFRRLPLDVAKGSFKMEDDRLEIDAIEVATDGLIRIEGNLLLDGQQVVGQFDVGVAPAALRWIPGAERKVFTREGDGLVWTEMQVGGTREMPEEDLSSRLRSAAIVATIEEAPVKVVGAAVGAVGTVGEVAVGTAGKVTSAATGVVGAVGSVAGKTLGVAGGLLGGLGGEPENDLAESEQEAQSGEEAPAAEVPDDDETAEEQSGGIREAVRFLPLFR